jgi:hypothetical protein
LVQKEEKGRNSSNVLDVDWWGFRGAWRVEGKVSVNTGVGEER